jgi:molecular chaperone GrpE
MAKGKDLVKVQLEQKVIDLEGKWKRALADYQNLEKRIERERLSVAGLINTRLLEKILPLLDELQICQRHLKDQGLQIVLDKFRQALKEEGVNEIDTLGADFDPEKMEAVEIVAGEKNKVMNVTAKGYEIEGQLIRPAKVRVGGGKGESKK